MYHFYAYRITKNTKKIVLLTLSVTVYYCMFPKLCIRSGMSIAVIVRPTSWHSFVLLKYLTAAIKLYSRFFFLLQH